MCLECITRANAPAPRRLGQRTAWPQQVQPAGPPGERNRPASKADVFRRASPSLIWRVISIKDGGGCVGMARETPKPLQSRGVERCGEVKEEG